MILFLYKASPYFHILGIILLDQYRNREILFFINTLDMNVFLILILSDLLLKHQFYKLIIKKRY